MPLTNTPLRLRSSILLVGQVLARLGDERRGLLAPLGALVGAAVVGLPFVGLGAEERRAAERLAAAIRAGRQRITRLQRHGEAAI
jgi:hypothetical protein